uniref:Uncharacterized protein n=1 Tax=Rhizophagus irregularis (strain DAOM 181602 / DAOM 197198 / MUCL 43194) TaxID=747089 RepID=U9UMD3_RHIID
MSLNFFGSKKAEMQGKFHKEQEFPYAPVNAGETKAQLEEKNPELEVSERTIRRELKNLGFVSIRSRRVSLLTQKAVTR